MPRGANRKDRTMSTMEDGTVVARAEAAPRSPRKKSHLVAVIEGVTKLAHRVIALEKRQLKLRIGSAFEIPEGKRLHAREMEIDGQTLRICTLEDGDDGRPTLADRMAALEANHALASKVEVSRVLRDKSGQIIGIAKTLADDEPSP